MCATLLRIVRNLFLNESLPAHITLLMGAPLGCAGDTDAVVESPGPHRWPEQGRDGIPVDSHERMFR